MRARSAPALNVTAIYELTPAGGKTMIDPLRYQADSKCAGSRRRRRNPRF